jgi:DNA mismatch endonuclease (patch repair protein)
MKFRRFLHGLGYRYRLHANDLPGKPDIVIRKHKVAIFVHGCFWHRHPDKKCKLARLPKSREDFWVNKLEGNYKRDIAKQNELLKLGWRVLVIWECELSNLDLLESKVKDFLAYEVD